MSYTLRQVLDDVASFINQDPTLATGTDLTSQVNLINQSQNEWAEADQWKALRLPLSLSVGASAVSLGLPSNFKKMMSPIFDMSVSYPTEYKEIEPSERFALTSSDKYFYIRGNDVTGKSVQINPGLASGASLVAEMQVYPSSMATLVDVATCPSKQFLVSRTIAKILGARSDPRFPTYKAESDSLLENMMEEDAAYSGAQVNKIPSAWGSFRIGDS